MRPRSGRRKKSPARVWLTIVAMTAAAVALVLVVFLDVPAYPAWVLASSVVLFLAYGLDKRRARMGGGRVPESVLHAVALAGGFPGGWVGRFVFRHKTRKPGFLLVLIVATMLHLGVVLWMMF